MGLKSRRGLKGTGAKHLTRASALRKLQVSLADFRRLCILKSVYPRDPKRKLKGRDKTYYHAKDILYLYHEPLLQKARELRAYERKHRRAVGRKDKAAARSLEKQRPLYSLYHIVKERYPTLVDAVRDLDDALSTAALFASLPANDDRQVSVKMVADATRVLDEFLFFSMEQRLVRKAFCSIKGFYIQLKLLGQLVTFLVPHQFPQELPAEVDFKVLTTFLELYIAVLRSVNFKLYRMEGFPYPPAVDSDMVRAGCRFLALQAAAPESAEGGVGFRKNAVEEEIKNGDVSTDRCNADTVQRRVQDILNMSRAASAQRDESGGGSGEESANESNCDEDEKSDDAEASVDEEDRNLGAGFEEDSTLQKFKALSEEDRRVQSLFSGLTFFIGREVPRVVFAFLVRSCGADAVGWQGDCSPFEVSDTRITHHIIDRQLTDSFSEYKTHREFVQPQWVLDSINTGLLMPVAPYAPGAILPPHLSPFVNDAEEGYMPQQRIVLDKLLNEKRKEEARLGAKDSDDEDDRDAMYSETKGDMDLEEAELHEQLHQKDIALEKRKRKAEKTSGAEKSDIANEGELTAACESLQESKKRRREVEMSEEVERRKALLSKKHKRLLDRIEFGKLRHSAKVEKLRSRRRSSVVE